MALLAKAAGQGHAYAMDTLGGVCYTREEYEQAMEWFIAVGRRSLTLSNPH